MLTYAHVGALFECGFAATLSAVRLDPLATTMVSWFQHVEQRRIRCQNSVFLRVFPKHPSFFVEKLCISP